jgi:hypothetical protein
MPSEVLYCTCRHEYQDFKYGKNRRLHTVSQKDKNNPHYTCTVCGNIKGKK